ncbi:MULTISPECIES: hypothetical protein [Haloferax]|uniref:DUF7979 domain-containing protein n=1 Tax=Haloferax marinum TaxID=2666143 RepID=A0A6A8G823_9EURY|nr:MULTISPECIES: hypothetical protein [Haloferax]KAB1197381.1 hypothetical protein Hfx1150_07570 [Haloferax sp. CBA1150]MRW96423.1 hypothetical protein [Haloferax marinum]
MPSNWQTLLVLGVALLAGCTGLGGSETAVTPDDPMTTAEPTTATAGTTAETTATTANDSPGYGTEFVSVSKLGNQSRYTEWPDNRSVHFENMTESRQTVFLDALDEQVEFGPEEENPFGFNDESRPEVVRYEGTWYFVRVAIV